jgi:hypothetical protein
MKGRIANEHFAQLRRGKIRPIAMGLLSSVRLPLHWSAERKHLSGKSFQWSLSTDEFT